MHKNYKQVKIISFETH